jgi:uncharacterized membrane protein YczE
VVASEVVLISARPLRDKLPPFPPLAVVKVAGFFTCVAIAQALLFRGKKPRLSSVLVGVVYIVGHYVSDAMTRNPSLLEFHVFILLIWLFIAVAGAFCGYAAGIAVGSVFLLSDVIRKSIQRRKHA